MIKEHVTEVKVYGETKETIDICESCPLPANKCNGNCDRYKSERKKLKTKKKKITVIY
jgi:hypothetical protein